MNPEKPEWNSVAPVFEEKAEEKNVRREWLRLASTASAGAMIFLLTGNTKRLYAQSLEGDLGILTAALYLEHEAVTAYQAGAESKLLSPGVLKAAVAFQSDHKYHRDGISGVLKSLGVEPKGRERSMTSERCTARRTFFGWPAIERTAPCWPMAHWRRTF